MGSWSRVRQLAMEKQDRICPVCNEPLGDDCIGHHIENKKAGGVSTVGNTVGRHRRCEELMHELYVGGNLSGGLKVRQPKLPRKMKKRLCIAQAKYCQMLPRK